MVGGDLINRCKWAEAHILLQQYHDIEWGIPCYDDNKLFECLTLEGAQAGLSWLTVLKKKEHYQNAFCKFNIQKVAAFTEEDFQSLLANSHLIQHKLKLKSVSHNANCILVIQEEFGSFSNYLWSFVHHKPIINLWVNQEDVPASTELSQTLSKSLKSYGFKFVGPTICYSFMQAIGMVNDHTIDCFKTN
ncbi:DNA-3-methyladenine glycosylase I [Halalkalibacter akibai]|uniref:DNA-3-methyladenine glycosylase n=1 Tax=Halalkalibacter akibai (strain ATCC 43226 / DSM 21942 / CIP 109018 / JCM 9157 / 1139) TaxID=1236973 RepID=W4QU91_HALA3|nr:DNA-3-methyladenine glycosylase I [Halalkalibacter akibai]GAE35183.1 DNA-3-methyladenine glycosylase [Halalkalibacter akibai JCM 9157]